jgi:hypothetical protein
MSAETGAGQTCPASGKVRVLKKRLMIEKRVKKSARKSGAMLKA